MLVEFTVENYRSFKEAKTLSMLPDRKLSHASNMPLIATGNKKIPYLLRMAGVYGANASGKSNLISAFRDAGRIIENGMHPKYVKEPLPIVPFKLDATYRTQPSRFTFHFIIDAVRYVYSFAAYPDRIAEESLYAYYSAQPSLLFERTEMDFTFGTKLTGANKTIEKRLKNHPRRLFLTQAADDSHEMLSPVWSWFNNFMSPSNYPQWKHEKHKKEKDQLLQFLRDADIAIDDIEWEEEKEIEDVFDGDERIFVQMEAFFKRRDNQGNVILFDFHEDESEGTKKLYSLFPLWLDMIEKNILAFFDELEEALHPNILEFLLRRIARLPETCGSQLIFTTHNVEILDMDILSRDAIWFTEKDAHHATDLYELSSFNDIRTGALIKKLYRHGKFGAVPRLPLE